MAPSTKDIQFRELKDTISQLNTTIRTQNDLIRSLQRMLEERNARDDEKDRIIANLQAQFEYFKQKLFGSSSEKRNDLPGQRLYPRRNSLNRIPVRRNVSPKRVMTRCLLISQSAVWRWIP